MRKRCAFLAAAVVCLAPLHGLAKERAPSCPLGTRVPPFSFLNLPAYDVEIVDGGTGDADGAADGACTVAVTACLGAPACVPTPVDEIRVSVRGKPVGTSPRALAREMLAGLARAPGSDARGAERLFFSNDQAAPDVCGATQFRLRAGSRRRGSARVRLTTRSGRARRGHRVRLRCRPADPEQPAAPRCSVGRRHEPCPGTPPVACQPGAPSATTTTTVVSSQPTTTTEGRPGASTTSCTAVSTPTTSTTLPAVPGAPRFYLSPFGRDDAAGTSRTRPWRTFDHAIGRLRPGDTLVLLDGTYSRGDTGLPVIDCQRGGNAVSGTAAAPITIRAEHERRALLSSDGTQANFDMIGCAWWRVEGLRARSRDERNATQGGGYPFRFRDVSHVTLRRLLGSHNNRMHNTHIFSFENSKHVLVEECEATHYHRHGFSVWRSWDVTLRRCYANAMFYGEEGCCSEIDNAPYGDVAFVFYGTSGSTIENSISDTGSGFNISGIYNALAPDDRGGRGNRILGSVSLDDDSGILISSRAVSGVYYNAGGNVVRDFVAAHTLGHALFVRGAADNVIENVTLYGSPQSSGLVVDGGDGGVGGTCRPPNHDGCSFVARGVLSVDHPLGQGFTAAGQDTWRIEDSNADGSGADWVVGEPVSDGAGHVRASYSADPGPVGLGPGECIMWIPEGSPMKRAGKDGRDIGANIVYRYVNGVLTDQPLWNPQTGAFPCGAVIEGVNDGPRSCANLHRRLNVNANGCRLPLP